MDRWTVEYQNIACVSSKQAYEWVKTGHWNLSQFEQWVKIIIEEAQSDVHDMYS